MPLVKTGEMFVCDWCGAQFVSEEQGYMCHCTPPDHTFHVGQVVLAKFSVRADSGQHLRSISRHGTIVVIDRGSPGDRFVCYQIDPKGAGSHGWVVTVELNPGQQPAPDGKIESFTCNNVESILVLDA